MCEYGNTEEHTSEISTKISTALILKAVFKNEYHCNLQILFMKSINRVLSKCGKKMTLLIAFHFYEVAGAALKILQT